MTGLKGLNLLKNGNAQEAKNARLAERTPISHSANSPIQCGLQAILFPIILSHQFLCRFYFFIVLIMTRAIAKEAIRMIAPGTGS
jgi:hypothetical protein